MKTCSSQPWLSLKRTGFQLSNYLISSPTIMIWKFKKSGLKKRVASPEVCDLLSGVPHPTSLFTWTWWVSLKPWYSLCVPTVCQLETMIQSLCTHCLPAWNYDTACVSHCLPAWWVSLETMIQYLCTPLFAGLVSQSGNYDTVSVYPIVCRLGESVWKLWYSICVPHCLPAWWVSLETMIQYLCTPLFAGLVSQSGSYDTVSVYPIVCGLETIIQSVYPTIRWLGESVWKLQQSPCVPL